MSTKPQNMSQTFTGSRKRHIIQPIVISKSAANRLGHISPPPPLPIMLYNTLLGAFLLQTFYYKRKNILTDLLLYGFVQKLMAHTFI